MAAAEPPEGGNPVDGMETLDREIRNCKKCAELLARHPVDPPKDCAPVVPRSILSQPTRAPMLLVGQAPGLTEYRSGQPFSGPAGGSVRQLFATAGLPLIMFDRAVYQTSAVKCFPGRKLNGSRWEDRPPCEAMRRHCRPFLARQIEMVSPRLIVAMGSVALSEMDKLRGLPRRALWEAVGGLEVWGDIRVLPISHTSGGNRSLNEPQNREKQARALAILREELAAVMTSSTTNEYFQALLPVHETDTQGLRRSDK